MTPKVETPPAPSAPFVAGQKPADMGSLSATIRDLMKPLSEVTKQGSPTKTDEVDAGTVKAASIQIAEPLTVHEPQQINAPFSVTLTVNAPGADAKAISAAVEGALAKQAAAHRGTIQSSLSD
ncbi:MAG: hypothetical protein E5V33_06360 [Mesorhizobium sp.]|nr:MAG: hypothetical protein E5V33_06360 [Mesorhizobium sp.]